MNELLNCFSDFNKLLDIGSVVELLAHSVSVYVFCFVFKLSFKFNFLVETEWWFVKYDVADVIFIWSFIDH